MYSGTTLFVAITNCQITCCRLSSSHKIGSAGIAGSLLIKSVGLLMAGRSTQAMAAPTVRRERPSARFGAFSCPVASATAAFSQSGRNGPNWFLTPLQRYKQTGHRRAFVMWGRQRIVEIGGGSNVPSGVDVLVDLPLPCCQGNCGGVGQGTVIPGISAGNARQAALGGSSRTSMASSPSPNG